MIVVAAMTTTTETSGRSNNNAGYGEPVPSRDNWDPYGGGRILDSRPGDIYSGADRPAKQSLSATHERQFASDSA